MGTQLSYSRTFPVDREQAYATVIALPLEKLFSRRYGAFPPIKKVIDAPPAWDAVGQTRRIKLADGGSVFETLTRVDAPFRFGYELSDISGPMKLLVAGVDGLWTFDPVGTGTRVTWSWDVTPQGLRGKAGMPALGRMWQGYARQAMEEMEKALVR